MAGDDITVNNSAMGNKKNSAKSNAHGKQIKTLTVSGKQRGGSARPVESK